MSYYILNFKDDTFQSVDSEMEVYTAFAGLEDKDNYAVVNGYNADAIDLAASELMDDLSEAMETWKSIAQDHEWTIDEGVQDG